MSGTPGPSRLLVAAILVVTVAACSNGQQVVVGAPSPSTSPSDRDARTTPAPFAVSPRPDDPPISAMVGGSAEPTWSDDSVGGTRPVLFVVPDDWEGLDDHRWVEVVSIDGSANEGGIYQELPGYLEPNPLRDRLTIQGHPAIRSPRRNRSRTSDSTAAFIAVNTSADAGAGDDIDGGDRNGLLVTGPADDLDLFESVARSATVAADRVPRLSDVPSGWQVLGSLSGSQVSGPNVWGIDERSLPKLRRVLQLGQFGDGEIRVSTMPGSSRTPALKALEASWAPDGSFSDLRRVQIGQSDAWLTICCDAEGTSAQAWFSIDGAPFEVTGPASRIGSPALLRSFVSTIRLTAEAEWDAAKAAMSASNPMPTYPPPGPTTTMSIVTPASGQ